jgi:peptidoglycan/LPS O-acetylase OafA/YrhL
MDSWRAEAAATEYVPELDGLRAVAIWLVFLYHAHVPGSALGWVGVQVFFALSGFLISRILLASRGGRLGPYVGRFLLRRTLRIFPLYYLYLVVNFAVFQQSQKYGYYAVYAQNVVQGVTAFQRVPGMLHHTWSLAVEEQFYLFWPFLVHALSLQRLRSVLVLLCISPSLIRFLVFAYSGNAFLTVALLPGQMDLLAFGALAALDLHEGRRVRGETGILVVGLGCAGIALGVARSGYQSFAWAPLWVPHNPAFLFWIGVCMYGVLHLVLGGRHHTFLVPLRWRPVLFTGRISYGLYMWHAMALALGSLLADRLGPYFPGGRIRWSLLFGIEVALAYGMATVSYFFFERHFLRLKNSLRRLP